MADHMHKEFMHANTKGTIILDSTDTDVLVLSCHHAPYCGTTGSGYQFIEFIFLEFIIFKNLKIDS